MSKTELVVHIEGGVARITLNRPNKRNALNRALLAALRRGVQDVTARGDLRLLMLAAAGPAFCAGMDLTEMQETASCLNAAEMWQADAQEYRDLLAAIFGLRVPTVAVVQGPAIAGGLGLVLACDMVIAADTAAFALPEPKRGITAAIVTPLLVYRAGAGNASYLLLSGKQVDAHHAQRLGICQEVVAADRLNDAASELAGSILSGSPLALEAAKEQVMSCTQADVLEQLDRAVVASAQARGTEEAEEGRRAFLEKRRPAWQPQKPGQ